MTATLLDATKPEDILSAARLLSHGGVCVIPTDTVYGLAARVLSEDALDRAYAVKQRPPEKRVPILIASASDLTFLVEQVPRTAWKLISAFWPGALTLVLPARRSVSQRVRGGGNTVGVRVPASRSCLQLLECLGEPVVGTSANVGGHPAARTAAEALTQLGEQVDAILADDGGVSGGLPSTVAEVVDTEVLIHRRGAIPVDAIRAAVNTRITIVEAALPT